MRKIQDFMKNRCGIDELNLFCLCLSLVFYFLYIFLSEEKKIFACLGCLIFVALSACRMFSENLEWRKKENQVFVKVCSFLVPERKETEEEREARKKEKLDKKKRKNEELRQKTTKKVEEIKEETKKEEKEEVVSKDERKESVERKKEEILRQREEKREREQREKEEKRRKEEEKRAAEALAREQKKREQRKREQKFDPNYVYFNCPYCNQAIRIPKRQGKVKITCPTCKNKFIKET